MIRAAALYIVIIIALLIAIISASLLSVAFYYRLGQQKKARIERLAANLSSGSMILLSTDYIPQDTVTVKDLYGDGQDSVLFMQQDWGIYQLNTVKAFQLRDTVKQVFFSGCLFTESAAIYLADEDRPLSVSGNTQITGHGELPKSGIKQSYVDGKPHTGREAINGKVTPSSRFLPPLQQRYVEKILAGMRGDLKEMEWEPQDSVINSFLNTPYIYRLKPGKKMISAKTIKGNIVLVSDTILTISNDTQLEDILIYAPGIIIENGFRGSCQLFARDSIIIGENCDFSYPSFAGVFKAAESKIQPKISLGSGSHFAGILLSYEKERSELQTRIAMGKDARVEGEVYATGYIHTDGPVTIFGKVYAKRFLFNRAGSVYENYLIDVVINRNLLNKHYLSSSLFKRSHSDNRILKWLY